MNRPHTRSVGDHMTRQQTQDALAGTPFGAYLETSAAQRTPEQRKQAGQARAWDNAGEWRDEALQCVREFLLTLPDRSIVNADEWREAIPIEPPHHNAYGALAGILAKRGWLEWTGDYTTSKQKQGHANVVKVWRVNRAAVERGEPTKDRKAAA